MTDSAAAEVPVQLPDGWRTAMGQRATMPERFARLAYEEYARQYGTQQSFDRLHERGGFGVWEAMSLLCDAIEKGPSRGR